jgi:hypothetical protein
MNSIQQGKADVNDVGLSIESRPIFNVPPQLEMEKAFFR